LTNLPVIPTTLAASTSELGSSLLRVGGALLLVISLFFAGIWLFKNWGRFVKQNGRAPKLNVLEVKSLGQRQAIYVIGYEQQRMLLASSPTGVSLVSHLPAATENETAPVSSTINFAAVLQEALGRK
jgi:flagellar biogenesis protein FliO